MANIYNPGNDLVSAYIQGRHLALQRQSEQFRQEQEKEQQQLEQKKFQEVQKEFELRHTLDQKKLEGEHALAVAQHNLVGQQLKASLADLYSRGIFKSTYQQETPEERQAGLEQNAYNLNTGGQPVFPKTAPVQVSPEVKGPDFTIPGVNLDLSQISTPEERGAAEASLKTPLLKAETQQKLDIAKALQPFEMQKIEAKGKQQTALQTQKDAAALQRTQATVEGQKAAASIRSQATVEAAKIKAAAPKTGAVLDDEQIGNDAMLAATGNLKVEGTTPQNRAVRQTLTSQGYVAFDPKDAAKLKAVNDVKGLYDFMTNFANTKLATSKLGAAGQAITSAFPLSDLNNLKKEVRARAGNISHVYGGEVGRLTDQDITRALGIMATPGITKDQALERLGQLKQETQNKVLYNILGGQKPKQQLLNLVHYEFDPKEFNTKVKGTDGKGHFRFAYDSSNNEWGYWNDKVKGYSAIGDE